MSSHWNTTLLSAIHGSSESIGVILQIWVEFRHSFKMFQTLLEKSTDYENSNLST